jgi:hypothetical protein
MKEPGLTDDEIAQMDDLNREYWRLSLAMEALVLTERALFTKLASAHGDRRWCLEQLSAIRGRIEAIDREIEVLLSSRTAIQAPDPGEVIRLRDRVHALRVANLRARTDSEIVNLLTDVVSLFPLPAV